MSLHSAAALALAAAGWIAPRRVAGARFATAPAMLLDAAPLSVVAAVLFVASGRPLLAGAIAFALGAGFAFADRTVRATLREPVVFSALAELPQIFTHPHLYLPFAGTATVLSASAGAVLAPIALLIAEPPAATPRPLGAALALAGVVALLWRVGREPWLAPVARALRRLRPSGEPFADASRLGPVAMLIVHGVVARAERPARQARLAPLPGRPPRLGPCAPPALRPRPVVLVQCESFFDARRALPTLPRGLLSGYDAACAAGEHGRLAVPAWGANTMRAEFAVLTGLPEAALGYDRFNPYHALARVPLASQVRRLRAAGYRTLCLHPFDRGFFRRDRALAALGFDEFLGRETLGGARRPPYMSDPALADCILRSLDRGDPRVFVFAITMGNHGPWPKDRGWETYLAGLQQSDEMLRRLLEGLRRRGDDALLGFYGDHLPSLPARFAALGFDDWRSDYVVWSAAGMAPRRRDLTADEFGRAFADLALAPEPADAAVVAALPPA